MSAQKNNRRILSVFRMALTCATAAPPLRESQPRRSPQTTPRPYRRTLQFPLRQQLTFAAFVESSHQNVEVPCTPRQATHAALLHCVE